MRKFLLILICIIALSLPILAADLTVSEAPFDITVNGQRIDSNDEYPFLFYKNVVYMPTTFNMNSFVGLRVEFYEFMNMKGEKTGSIFVGLDKITTDAYAPYQKVSGKVKGKIHEELVVINECYHSNHINNTAREYPIINYKNVLYVPLTYDIAVEMLDWKMEFSPEAGLILDTTIPNRPILDKAQSGTVGYSRIGLGATFIPEYAYGNNAYAAYPHSTLGGGRQFRYKERGGQEKRFMLPFDDGDYSFNRVSFGGTDNTYDKKYCIATLDENGILRMPATKTSKETGYTKINVYLTIDLKNEVILSMEEYTLQKDE